MEESGMKRRFHKMKDCRWFCRVSDSKRTVQSGSLYADCTACFFKQVLSFYYPKE